MMEQIHVSISDTGKGISPQIMPRLFEEFVTGSDTGTGLELYITRNLVEAHGGRIWALMLMILALHLYLLYLERMKG